MLKFRTFGIYLFRLFLGTRQGFLGAPAMHGKRNLARLANTGELFYLRWQSKSNANGKPIMETFHLLRTTATSNVHEHDGSACCLPVKPEHVPTYPNRSVPF